MGGRGAKLGKMGNQIKVTFKDGFVSYYARGRKNEVLSGGITGDVLKVNGGLEEFAKRLRNAGATVEDYTPPKDSDLHLGYDGIPRSAGRVMRQQRRASVYGRPKGAQ